MRYDQAKQRQERGCMYKLNCQRFSQLLWPSSGRIHVHACHRLWHWGKARYCKYAASNIVLQLSLAHTLATQKVDVKS